MVNDLEFPTDRLLNVYNQSAVCDLSQRRADVAGQIQKSSVLKLLREGKMTPSGEARLVDRVLKAWNDTRGMGRRMKKAVYAGSFDPTANS